MAERGLAIHGLPTDDGVRICACGQAAVWPFNWPFNRCAACTRDIARYEIARALDIARYEIARAYHDGDEVIIDDKGGRMIRIGQSSYRVELTERHMCGLRGYNPMLGDTCPACEQSHDLHERFRKQHG